MINKAVLLGFLLCLSINLSSCKHTSPPPVVMEGDLYFSGYYWNFKNSNDSLVGPGPNRFSSKHGNIWIGADKMLHMKIVKDSNKWYCSELVSVKEFGYGTYIFTTASDLTTMNEKVVLGLFTWNNYSFQTQANSEVDIEFARWNLPNDSLLCTYSVQPVWTDIAPPYLERTRKPPMKVGNLKGTCTHAFTWTPDLITWVSFKGDVFPGTDTLASWSFDKFNKPRTKSEGSRISNPIVIPAPEDSTNVRFNLWLLFGQAPANDQGYEVVIKSFRFIPL